MDERVSLAQINNNFIDFVENDQSTNLICVFFCIFTTLECENMWCVELVSTDIDPMTEILNNAQSILLIRV